MTFSGCRLQSNPLPNGNLLTNGNVPSMSRTQSTKLAKFSESERMSMAPPMSLKPVETISNPELEIKRLTDELQKNQEVIRQLQEREQDLINRFSERAQKEFKAKNNNFEDLSLGENRPTELIKRFSSLYSESRVDALDALDEIQQLEEMGVLKGKILFSIVVLSFRAVQQALDDLRGKLRHVLNLPLPMAGLDNGDSAAMEMEGHVDSYLQKTVGRFDLSSSIDEVCTQIYATLYDYPSLKQCEGLQQYVSDCVRIAWGLTVQSPSFVILYDSRVFHPQLHTRFHTSNPDSEQIMNFLWPALLEGPNGRCVQKAMVVT
ncbi:hypothetical protein ScPMuIL_000019 [Solemya velum]